MIDTTNAPGQGIPRTADLVRLSADGIVVVDANGVVQFANPAAEKILGCDPGGAVGFHLGYPAVDQEAFTLTLMGADGRPAIVEMRAAETIWAGEPAFVMNLRDVTELIRYETERAAERDGARQYFEVAAVLLVALNADGTVVEINPRGCQVLGASREEIVGRNWFDTFIADDGRESVRDLFHRILAGEPSSLEHVEEYVLRADGEKRLISWRNSVLRDATGAATGTLSSGEDVTGLRSAEMLTRRYQDLVESMRVGVHLYHLEVRDDDRTLRMIALNPAAEQITGVKRDELVGMTLDECFPGLREQGVPQLYAAVVRTGEARDLGEIEYGDARVEKQWFDVRVIPLPGDCVAATFDSVTDRRRAEATAREAKLRMEEAVTGGNVGLWDWDLATNRVRFSREWKAQIGHREDEIGENFEEWRSRVHPEDLGTAMDIITAAVSGGIPSYRTEFRFRHKDGSWRWILAQASVHRDKTGAAVRLVGSHIDITARKEGEAALEKSRGKLQSLFDNMTEGFALHEIVLDDSGKPVDYVFLEINEAFKKHTGLTDDIIGRRVTDVHPGIKRMDFDWIGTYGRVALSRRPTQFEQHFGPQDRWYRISAFCPEVGRFAVVFSDITERKAAEIAIQEALESAEARSAEAQGLLDGARAVLENLPFEDAAERLLGSCERLTGATFGFVAMLDETGVAKKALALDTAGGRRRIDLDRRMSIGGLDGKAYRTGRPVYSNDYRSSPDQGSLPEGYPPLTNVLFAPIMLDGRVVAMIGIGNKPGDFTERDATIASSFSEMKAVVLKNQRALASLLESEEQLRQSQKMEAVGRLAGGVAHDFNNLLMAMLGHCEIARKRLRDEDPLAANLAQIKSCGEKAATLTRQLLAFSRRQPLDAKVVDVNLLLAELERMLRRLIGEDIEFLTEFAPDLGRVKVDPGQLDQVVMNLVLNARDAMPDGGTLIVQTANVDLDGTFVHTHIGATAGAHVRIVVKDTGCGMDGETVKRVFEPFFTTKQPGKGTGLGLATAYGIVQQSGGSIWVQSEPGKGTAFEIYLPRVEDELAAVSKRAETGAHRGTGECILVVEDEAPLRELLEAILEDLGYRVQLAANGSEALLAIEEDGLVPDLVITDLVMPGMNGRVLVNRLHQNRPDLKVLFMSGYADSEIWQGEAGTAGLPFLTKPFDIQSLATKLREVLDA